jgi:hypothetical protein
MTFYIERLDKKGEHPIPLAEGTTSLGRNPRNTIALPADNRCVSGYHALIYVMPNKLLLQDMQSTNGTFVNNMKIEDECDIKIGDVIGLGMSGPRFRVVRGNGADGAGGDGADVNVMPRHHDMGDPQTLDSPVSPTITMKTPVTPVIAPATPAVTVKKPVVPKYIIGAVVAAVVLTALILVASFTSGGAGKTKPLASPSSKFTFKRGEPSAGDIDEDFDSVSISAGLPVVEARIDAILRRFGEHDYQIPPEMIERIKYYLGQYTGPMKRIVATYMERRKQYFPMIRRVFAEKNIPLDLAYVSIIESGLDPDALSRAGAKGLWQFMPKTARDYGLEVSAQRDERTDPEKSTYAAAAYFKDLIAIFGSKSSVMLCMAAYNAGEARIIGALKRINDPVNNRDFWYLYKKKWLAEETNEYIPQILALIIISEHLEEYGFE